MDPSSQFIVPTIIDVPELIVTNEDSDYDEMSGPFGSVGSVWTNKLQFLTLSLSYAIGLGNLWRFPYLCYKHSGGAFLIAYTFVLFTIGLPLVLMEMAFGQYANEGPITIWRISPAFEGIGYSMCLISGLVAIYYLLINTWLLHYLFATLSFGSLPWTSCNNKWNSEHCFLNSDDNFSMKGKTNCTGLSEQQSAQMNNNSSQMIDIMNATTLNNSSILLVPGNCTNQNASSFEFDKVLNTTNDVILPSNEYFHNSVLELSSDSSVLGSINWSFLFNSILLWALTFVVLLKNLRPIATNNNYMSLASIIMPYLTLFALLTRSITLDGSQAGLLYLMSPSWLKLQNIDVWADAITQVFFSLSPCWGGIITLANMNKFHNNFHSNAVLIMVVNYITSILASCIAFATLGFMSQYSGIKIDEVVDSGIGFIFQVYPETLAQLPYLTNVNSLIFFATLLYLGFNNQLTVIETVLTTIVDTWPHKLRYRRPLVLMILCTTMLLVSILFCFGNAFYVMQVLDMYVGTFSGMIIGILELIAISWVYGMENFMQDINDMISVHRNLFPSRSYWYFMWRYLTPSIIFAILLFSLTDYPTIMTKYRDVPLPSWAFTFGWILTVLCVAFIPVIASIRFLMSPSGSFIDKISYLCRPSEDWAPSSYISGPKLINRHHQMLDDKDLRSSGNTSGYGYDDDDAQSNQCGTIYISKSRHQTDGHYENQSLVSNDDDEDDEDLKVVDGKANYIIPEEEDDTDTCLITTETNV